MFPELIALGGVARAGKDTFYQTLARLRPGAIRISIGDVIREDCKRFIKGSTSINVHKCTDEEKEIIRPILVGYGISLRKLTSGGYFRTALDELMRDIKESPKWNKDSYFVMTDLRFAEYEFDEPEWIKCHNGVMIHISRIMSYIEGEEDDHGRFNWFNQPKPKYLQPANDTERENDPKIKAKADFVVEWENRNDPAYFEAIVNQALRKIENIQKTS